MDSVVDLAHQVIGGVQWAVTAFMFVSQGGIPRTNDILIVANAMFGAVRQYEDHKASGKPPMYWLHSVVLLIVTTFGGGTIAPLLIGRPAVIVANDIAVPAIIICWYIINYTSARSIFMWQPMKVFNAALVGLFRTNSQTSMVALANASLQPRPDYPVPLTGPIVAATLVGSLGAFLPADRGLASITQGTPWPMQAAFISSTFYHLVVFDKTGFIGVAFRSIVGNYTEPQARAIIAAVNSFVLVAQAALSPEANPFTPLHKLLYLLFQVRGPVVKKTPAGADVGWSLRNRIVLERLLEVSRMILVLLLLCTQIYFTCAPTSMSPASPSNTLLQLPMPLHLRPSSGACVGLQVGHALGSCQLSAQSTLPWSSCNPRMLTLDPVPVTSQALRSSKVQAYKLAVYEGRPAALAGGAGENCNGRTWVRNICANRTASSLALLKPLWEFPLTLTVTSDTRTALRSLCGRDAAVQTKSVPTCSALTTVANSTAQVNTPVEAAQDSIDWGNCSVSVRLVGKGLGLVLGAVGTAGNGQELLLWSSGAVCVGNSTAVKLTLKTGASAGVEIACSDGKRVTVNATLATATG